MAPVPGAVCPSMQSACRWTLRFERMHDLTPWRCLRRRHSAEALDVAWIPPVLDKIFSLMHDRPNSLGGDRLTLGRLATTARPRAAGLHGKSLDGPAQVARRSPPDARGRVGRPLAVLLNAGPTYLHSIL